MQIRLTINLKDGSEIADLHGEVEDFSGLPAEIDRFMAAEVVTPERWSSVMVTVVNADDLTVTGPYQYTNDLHPSFRISSSDRIVASVFASDGDTDRAERIAHRIAAAIAKANA